jgi:hypothetical protein
MYKSYQVVYHKNVIMEVKNLVGDVDTNLHHCVTHEIVFKPFKLKLQNRREVDEKNAFLCILKQQISLSKKHMQ